MITRAVRHVRGNAVAWLALFVSLGGTGAYAANTIGSADIIDESIVSADLKNYGVKRADIGLNSINDARIEDASVKNPEIGLNAVTSSKVLDNTLTAADVDESSLQVTQGAGTRVLANRLVLLPGPDDVVLFTIPGLGEIRANCGTASAFISWVNTTSGHVDSWSEAQSGGVNFATVTPPGNGRFVTVTDPANGERHVTELSVGDGNSPGPRRMATIHGFALQQVDGNPCGFQASGIYWETAD